MKFKRFSALVLALGLLVSVLSACGDSGQEDSTPSEPVVTSDTPEPSGSAPQESSEPPVENPTVLNGTWRWTGLASEVTWDEEDDFDAELILTLREDFTCTMQGRREGEEQNSVSGTYKMDGLQLIVTDEEGHSIGEGESENVEYEYVPSTGEIIFRSEAPDRTYELVFAKAD